MPPTRSTSSPVREKRSKEETISPEEVGSPGKRQKLDDGGNKLGTAAGASADDATDENKRNQEHQETQPHVKSGVAIVVATAADGEAVVMSPINATTDKKVDVDETAAPETAKDGVVAEQQAKSSSTSSKTPLANIDWEDYFKLLQEYKSENGGLTIPASNDDKYKSLRDWLQSQSSKLADKDDTTLSTDQRQRLLELGVSPTTTTTTVAVSSTSKNKKNEGDIAGGGGGQDDAGKELAETAAPKGGKLTLRMLQWNEKFEELQQFQKIHGHCDARDTPQVNKYKSLAKWIQRQQAKMGDNTLSADQLKRLIDLGVKPAENAAEPQDRTRASSGSLGGDGGSNAAAATAATTTGGENGSSSNEYEPTASQKKKWETKFEELQQFHAKNGHLNVPKYDPTTNDYNPLEGWVQRQRLKMRKDSGLSSEQKQRLVEIGLTPSAKTDGKGMDEDDSGSDKDEVDDPDSKPAATQRLKQWESKFEQLEEFKKLHGHCDVPTRGSGYDSLASWVQRQRVKVYEKEVGSNLSDDQKQRLVDLGLGKNPTAAELPKKRKKEDSADDDKSSPPTKKRTSTSSDTSKQDVDNAKKDTASSDNDGDGDKSTFRIQQWEKKYTKVKQFYSEHGHVNLGDAKSEDPKQMLEYKSLWNWVKYQRPRLVGNHPSLNSDQRQRLLDLGITPEKYLTATEKDDEKWEKKFALLQEFKKEHGHCNVPDRLKPHQEKFVSLKKWIRLQREHTRNEDPELTPERKERLDALGFQAKAPASGEGLFDATFQRRLQELKEYKKEHGDLDVTGSTSLGKWTQSIRRHYNKLQRGDVGSLLKTEQVNALESIGFTFVTGTPRPRTIEESVGEYIAFFKTHGRFPIRRASNDAECRLHNAAGRWREKKGLFDKGIKKHPRLGTCEIPQNMIDQLNAVNFRWDTLNRKKAGPPTDWTKQPWENKFRLLKEYMDQHNGVAPVNTYPGLGSFVAGLRKNYRDRTKGNRSTLSEERFRQLKEIGFDFTSPKPGRRWHKKEDENQKAPKVETKEEKPVKSEQDGPDKNPANVAAANDSQSSSAGQSSTPAAVMAAAAAATTKPSEHGLELAEV